MQRFTTGSLSFTIPTTWDEVTLAQFLTLTAPDAPQTPGFVITTLSGLDESDLRSQSAPFDLSGFVVSNLNFVSTLPVVPDELPKTVTIGGKTNKLPSDLGAVATLGQMWDVEFVITSMQAKEQAVNPVSMIETLLPVYLWPLLKTEPYTNRHTAAELWPLIQAMPCVEALSVSAFFLRNSLSPLPSGKISMQTLHKTPSKRWRLSSLWALIGLRSTTPQIG